MNTNFFIPCFCSSFLYFFFSSSSCSSSLPPPPTPLYFFILVFAVFLGSGTFPFVSSFHVALSQYAYEPGDDNRCKECNKAEDRHYTNFKFCYVRSLLMQTTKQPALF
eukprot:765275-Hanusia_phi.AAC.4